MIFPVTTAFFAGLFGLLYVGLSSWVVGGRVSNDVLFGGGGDSLQRRIRAHGNFSEFVPLALLLVAFLEAGGTKHWIVQALLVVLLIGRILHPFGLFAPKNSPQQFACRGGGILTTLIVLLISSILLLV
ncbi:MAPEG family protein [Methylobacterium thuringiense]|uniref:Inner membrane protein YecN n=1 Tax=Methylobacterium thuringiense TaxID=1003091 RepID=A0ABQ4TJ38_9HYPH|nr:MAPEG family protein [Methylobacterium thuringiense]GJE54244.1 Inner membrane protein YecN [Methylobacterium thuringiense]